MLRSPGEISSEEEAKQAFDELWPKILTEMEQTLDREHIDLQLFKEIHGFYPEKERRKRPEMWDQAKNLQQKDLRKDFDWKSSKSLLCNGKAPNVSEGASKGEYKYLKLEGQWDNACAKFQRIMKRTPSSDPLGTVAVRWNKIQKEVLKIVEQNLSSDTQLHAREIKEIHQKVLGVVDEVNAELAHSQQRLSLEALGEIGTLVIIRTWQLKREAVWQEHMKPIEEFKAEETKQKQYFCSQVLQSPEADRKMAEAWLADIIRRCVREELSLASEDMEVDIVKNQKQLSRGSIERFLDEGLLGSDDLDKQEEYIDDPKKILEQELVQRFSKILEVDTMNERKMSKLRGILDSLKFALQGLCDKPELCPENCSAEQLLEAQDFAKDPVETDNARKQALSQWIVSYLTIGGVLPSRWSVDEEGQPVAYDDQTDNWQVKATQVLPCTGSPVKSDFLKECIKVPRLSLWALQHKICLYHALSMHGDIHGYPGNHHSQSNVIM